MQRLILLCLYTGGVSFAFFLPVFEFSLDYVIIWQLHIWQHSLRYLQEPQQARKGNVFKDCCLYLLSLSRLSTSLHTNDVSVLVI